MGHDRFEDFVGDGGQDSFVVVKAESAEDLGEVIDGGPGEDSDCDVDHLQVYGFRAWVSRVCRERMVSSCHA